MKIHHITDLRREGLRQSLITLVLYFYRTAGEKKQDCQKRYKSGVIHTTVVWYGANIILFFEKTHLLYVYSRFFYNQNRTIPYRKTLKYSSISIHSHLYTLKVMYLSCKHIHINRVSELHS